MPTRAPAAPYVAIGRPAWFELGVVLDRVQRAPQMPVRGDRLAGAA